MDIDFPLPTPPPHTEQNDHHFADDIFKCIFMNIKLYIFIKLSLMFVLKGPFDTQSVLVQVMAWRRRTNADPVHRCIYAALGGDELNWVKTLYHCTCMYLKNKTFSFDFPTHMVLNNIMLMGSCKKDVTPVR